MLYHSFSSLLPIETDAVRKAIVSESILMVSDPYWFNLCVLEDALLQYQLTKDYLARF